MSIDSKSELQTTQRRSERLHTLWMKKKCIPSKIETKSTVGNQEKKICTHLYMSIIIVKSTLTL